MSSKPPHTIWEREWPMVHTQGRKGLSLGAGSLGSPSSTLNCSSLYGCPKENLDVAESHELVSKQVRVLRLPSTLTLDRYPRTPAHPWSAPCLALGGLPLNLCLSRLINHLYCQVCVPIRQSWRRPGGSTDLLCSLSLRWPPALCPSQCLPEAG